MGRRKGSDDGPNYSRAHAPKEPGETPAERRQREAYNRLQDALLEKDIQTSEAKEPDRD